MNNFNNMMKQAQELQNKMTEAQKKVEQLEAEGSSGGGLINSDEKEILEDLIVAAFNDAKEKIQKKISDEMSSITGGIKLPPGIKLPF